MKDINNNTEVNINNLQDIPVKITVLIGKAHMKVAQVLQLTKGSVIELDKKIGDPVDIYVNDKLIAKGEIVVVDNKIGVTLTEITSKRD